VIYDDQPQMLRAAQQAMNDVDRKVGPHMVLVRSFAAIDQEDLIEKIVRARDDSYWSLSVRARVEHDLIVAGIIPGREQ
jgi:uncharacterized membrane protein